MDTPGNPNRGFWMTGAGVSPGLTPRLPFLRSFSTAVVNGGQHQPNVDTPPRCRFIVCTNKL